MAREQVIGSLITKLGFNSDLSGLSRYESKIDNVSQKLNSFGNTAIGVGGALTGAATAAVSTFIPYETTLAQIEGLVGVSRAQLDLWQDDITRIARSTGQSASDLATALYYVTSAGLSGSTAMEVLEATAKAAAVGLGDQSDLVDLVTSAVNAYGAENLSAADAIDTLTEAVRLGKLEPAALASSMGSILPVASALEVQFSEVSGMMAAMSRTGTGADEAVVQLQAVMTTLLKPSAEAEKALASVGMSAEGLRKVAGEQGLWAVLENLNTAFGDNDEAMAQIFPNIRALRGVFDLLGSNIEDNRAIMDDMQDSTGLLDHAFQIVSNTTGYDLSVTMAQFKSILKDLGERVVPTLQKSLDVLQAVMARYDDLPEWAKSLAGAALSAGPAIIGVGIAAKSVAWLLGPLVGIIKTLAGTGLAGGLLGGMKAGLTGVAAASGPVGWAIAGIVLALVGAGLAIYKYWEPIKAFFEGFFSGLQTGWVEVQAALEPLTPLWTTASMAIGAVGLALQSVWQWFTDLLAPIAATSQAVDDARQAGVDFAASLLGVIARIISFGLAAYTGIVGVVSLIRSNWAGLIPFFEDFPDNILGWLAEAQDIWDPTGALQGIWNGIVAWYQGLGNTVWDFLAEAKATFSAWSPLAKLQWVWFTVKAWALSLTTPWDWLQQIVGDLTVWSPKALLEAAWKAITDWVEGLTGLWDFLGVAPLDFSVWSPQLSLEGIWVPISQWLESLDAWSWLGLEPPDFTAWSPWQTLIDVWTPIQNWLSTLSPWLLLTLVGPFGWAALLIRRFWEPLGTFFETLVTGLKDGWEDVRAKLEEVRGEVPLLDAVLDSLGLIVGALALGIQSVYDWLNAWLDPLQSSTAEMEGARAAGQSLADVLISIVLGLIGAVAGVGIWVASLGTTLRTTWTSLIEFFTAFPENILGWLDEPLVIWDPLIDIQGIWNAIVLWAQGLDLWGWLALEPELFEVWTPLVKLQETWDEIVDWTKGLANPFKDVFSDTGDLAAQAEVESNNILTNAVAGAVNMASNIIRGPERVAPVTLLSPVMAPAGVQGPEPPPPGNIIIQEVRITTNSDEPRTFAGRFVDELERQFNNVVRRSDREVVR